LNRIDASIIEAKQQCQDLIQNQLSDFMTAKEDLEKQTEALIKKVAL
jgi:16S rRNA U1498 N3-methylase RsmE